MAELSVSTRRGRVAHVMRHYGEPSQTFVSDAVVELDRLGWEGWVVARRVANREWFPFPPDERVVLASRPSLPRRVAGRLRERSATLRSAGWYGPAIERVRPDVIQAHFAWSAVPAFPAAERLGVPLVVSVHATDVTVYPAESPEHRAAYDAMWGHVAVATAVSRFTEARLREAGYRGPVEILPAGVRLAELPYRGPGDPGEDVRLLFIGRLVPRKGLDVLLRALPAVRQRYPGVRLEVVGDGPLREELEALVRELALTTTVTFLGAASQAQVRARLQEAHVLVMPSRTTPDGEAEGSPMVTKEAQAVGLQVVATDCGGTVETMPPERREEVVAEDAPEALADRILAVLGDRARWPEQAASGRRWVEQEFDARRLAERMAAIYARLTG